MDLNLTTAWQMTRHAVDVLPRGGAIVNISSVGVRARGPGMVYNLAKAALENLTVGAANTLGERGVRVNCVQVGAIWGAFAAANMSPEMREVRKGWSALGTEGNPWDIAQATLFLASDHARWVSGQILSVDGGPGVGRPPKPVPPPTVEVDHPRGRSVGARVTVALVTGCGKPDGMGQAIARRLAAQGTAVVVTDLEPSGVPNASQEQRSSGWGGRGRAGRRHHRGRGHRGGVAG